MWPSIVGSANAKTTKTIVYFCMRTYLLIIKRIIPGCVLEKRGFNELHYESENINFPLALTKCLSPLSPEKARVASAERPSTCLACAHPRLHNLTPTARTGPPSESPLLPFPPPRSAK